MLVNRAYHASGRNTLRPLYQYLAENLAFQHVYKEIEKLWSSTNANVSLQNVFGLSQQDKAHLDINYSLEGCTLCPGLGDWDDTNEVIDYIEDYILNREGKDENINVKSIYN